MVCAWWFYQERVCHLSLSLVVIETSAADIVTDIQYVRDMFVTGLIKLRNLACVPSESINLLVMSTLHKEERWVLDKKK